MRAAIATMIVASALTAGGCSAMEYGVAVETDDRLNADTYTFHAVITGR